MSDHRQNNNPADKSAEELIRAKVEELNAAILAAHARGLYVGLGVGTSIGTDPSYSVVSNVRVERDIDWETGQLRLAPEDEENV